MITHFSGPNSNEPRMYTIADSSSEERHETFPVMMHHIIVPFPKAHVHLSVWILLV